MVYQYTLIVSFSSLSDAVFPTCTGQERMLILFLGKKTPLAFTDETVLCYSIAFHPSLWTSLLFLMQFQLLKIKLVNHVHKSCME